MSAHRPVTWELLTLSVLTIISAPAALAAAPLKSPQDAILQQVKIDQKIGDPLPLDAAFKDSTGRDVRLGDYFKDKPVIVTMVYYECPMLCTLVLNGLVRALRPLSLSIGKDFEVVTVSFNPKEGPELAAAKKKSYLDSYRRDGGGAGWHFLTGDEHSIHRLTDALGFHYAFDPERGEYAHGAAIMLATPDGHIARYFFGVEYPSNDVRLALVEASAGTVGTVVDQLLLLCYHYDPSTGRYTALTLGTLRVGGLITLMGLVGFIGFMTRRERTARRRDT